MDTHTLTIVAITAVVTTISGLVAGAFFTAAKEVIAASTRTTVTKLFSSTNLPITINLGGAFLCLIALWFLVLNKTTPVTRIDVFLIAWFSGGVLIPMYAVGHYTGVRAAIKESRASTK
jgi:hypothetical protein